MSTSSYATLRRFNRAWTQRIGALDESFLGSGRPLGSARLLFEIGPDGAGVLDLRRRLGLDSGYLSRLLRRLTEEGLVEVVPDPDDRRRRLATLTARGHREWQTLEDRSERLAHDLVAPLSESQRARLDEALATAELLVRAATLELEAVSASSGEAVAAVHSYFDELDRRFAGGFDPGDAWTQDAAALAPPEGLFVVARDEGRVVGCGGVQRITGSTAEIKRMWVHPGWRGAGLGTRLLRHLEDEARRLGYSVVRLDTNGTLTEAVAMYERAGYLPIERYNDNPYAQAWFEKELSPSGGASGS